MSISTWTFFCYVDAQGVDAIDDWYQRQSEDLQAKFDTRIKYLRAQKRERWTRPYFDMLHDECKGIGEIIFEHKNVQYRPLGFFSGSMAFTLALIATKKSSAKGTRFDPKNACEIVNARRRELETDRRKARVCNFE